MRVGVFDSGAGGLTVAKSLLENPIFDEIIYYGDTARVPYGTKDSNTIIRYALEAIEFFNNFNIDCLITACNTVSAYSLPAMRDKAKYPIYGVIEPGVLALCNKIKNKDANILIIGTRATINSKRYQNSLEDLGYKNITSIQTGMLVPVVEEGILEGKVLDEMFNYYFKDIKTPDAIILGCTHFPLISKAIYNYFNNKPLLIHSGDAIVEFLHTKGYSSSSTKPDVKIYASDNVEGLRDIATKWISYK
jgi:glutamate racemase